MNLKTSYIVEQAFEAIEGSKFGRFHFCVESLLEGLGSSEMAYQEDPRFGLIVLLEKGLQAKGDSRFVKLSLDTLRRLCSETEGQLGTIYELRLAWQLLCLECHVDSLEHKQKIRQELDSLPQSKPLSRDKHHMLALWYWFRYWYKRYQSDGFLYFFLACSVAEELEGRFPRLEIALNQDKDLLKSFLLLYEPIHEDEQLFRTFKKHAQGRGLGGVFTE